MTVILGDYLRADYSNANQAWLIRPFNKDWPIEAQLAAPVTRIVNSQREAEEIVLDMEVALLRPVWV